MYKTHEFIHQITYLYTRLKNDPAFDKKPD